MIVQSAPMRAVAAGVDGWPDPVGPARLVLTMQQHTATARVLARHFGGVDGFDRLEPLDLMVDLVGEHDRGWIPVDDAAPRCPGTGLPWSVYETPTTLSIGTGPRSIDHNESRHPYRGLLASLHIVGIYDGRHGLDPTRVLDVVPAESRELLEPMIAAERRRQERLTEQLEADPVTARWMGPVLWRNYKALQLFDRLALWLQVTHPADRRPTTIADVPTTGGGDVTVEVSPIDERVVRIDPFPFDTDPLDLTVEGRWLVPQPPGVDLAAALADAPPAHQPVTLVGPG
jgi:hypothetical protein